MRKTFLLIFTILLITLITANADELSDKFSLSVNTYIDNTNSDIITTKLNTVKRLSEKYGIGIDAGYDAISSATPLNRADNIDEDRDDEGNKDRFFSTVTGIYNDVVNNISVSGYYSKESDYTGRSVFVNYSRIMNNDNTSISTGISQSFDSWDISGLTEDERNDSQLNLSASQFLTNTSQVQLIYTLIYSDGFLASPYRNVDIGSEKIYERLPSDRTAHAVAIKLIKLINEPTSVHLYYRYYFDDWEIRSHTVSVDLYRDITDYIVLGGSYRYYNQDEASFTKKSDQYKPDDTYIAIDYKYSNFTSNTIGINLMLTPQWEFFSFIDWESAKFKISADYYITSDNDWIKNWYGEDFIQAAIISTSFEYLY